MRLHIVRRHRSYRLALAGSGLAMFALADVACAAAISSDVQVAVVTPLSLVKTGDLRFGSIIPGAAAGTVRIFATTGARVSTGPLTLVGTDYGPATFLGLADRNRFVTLTRGPLPTLVRVGGGASMRMTAMTTQRNNFTTPGGQILYINIGGTLAVGANQPVGLYRGTFSITINYQ